MALRALGPESDRVFKLNKLRPALRCLRHAYNAGLAPDFSRWEQRAAYTFAYFPHHPLLAAASYLAAGPALLGLEQRIVRIVVLGAGPGPELVGLAHVMAQLGIAPDRVEVHLVDRESAWSKTRKTTLEGVLPVLCDVAINVPEHCADLATENGLATITPLICDATLVVAETVLTELSHAGGDTRLLDHLFANVGAETRLLIVDLHRAGTFRPISARLDESGMVTVLRARVDLPAGRPIDPLASALFHNSDGLRPRSTLRAEVRVLSRPGILPSRSLKVTSPTAGQEDALAAFARFLNGSERVFVLRGAAGTGETTLFASMIEVAAADGLPICLLAPTGQAARRLVDRTERFGSTIHSVVYEFAENRLVERTEESQRDEEEHIPVAVFKRADAPQEACLYLVDEASLIGNRRYEPEELDSVGVQFGEGTVLSDLLRYTLAAPGSKVVLAGDPDQLPPIGETESPALAPAIVAALIDEAPVLSELTEVVRQESGSMLIEYACKARLATHRLGLPAIPDDPAFAVSRLKSQVLEPWLREEVVGALATVVAYRNADVAAWNRRIRIDADRPDDRPVSGDRLIALFTDTRTGLLNGDELEVVKAADKVEVVRSRAGEVSLRSAILRKVLPGIGAITLDTLLVDDLLRLATAEEQRRVTKIFHVDFIVRSNMKPDQPGFDEARRNDPRVGALRVAYAYARTCHRAQGGEWNNVIVDYTGIRQLGPIFGRWAYTALTRARRAAWLHNVPRDRAPMGGDVLAAGALQAFEAAGLEVRNQQQLQNGVKLIVADRASFVTIDLYERNGLPSRALRVGPPRPGIEERALDVLLRWIEDEQRAAEEDIPDVLHLVLKLAKVLSGRWPDKALEQLRRIDPTRLSAEPFNDFPSPAARWYLAASGSLYSLESWDELLRVCDEAISATGVRDADRNWLQLRKAAALTGLARYAEAVDLLLEFRRVRDVWWVDYRLAVVYAAVGDHKAALTIARRALANDPIGPSGVVDGGARPGREDGNGGSAPSQWWLRFHHPGRWIARPVFRRTSWLRRTVARYRHPRHLCCSQWFRPGQEPTIRPGDSSESRVRRVVLHHSTAIALCPRHPVQA